MIEDEQDELYQLENKQEKGAKPCANIRQEREGVQIKQYWNHILRVKNQNILEIVRTILNLQKQL